MHSFISSSKRRSPLVASVSLLLALALVYVGLELACRRAVVPASRILRGNIAEWQAASNLRHLLPPAHTALVVGNSLLDAGVDFPQLQSEVALANPGWHMQRLMIEGTYYFDWYYGLRRLLADGARPDMIILVLSPEQLISSNYRDSLFAPMMLQAADLLSLSRAADIRPTEASGLLLGHYSWCYGFRAEWRKNLLRRVIPGMGDLARLFIPNVPSNSLATPAGARLESRLEALRKLTAEARIQLVIVLPPLVNARPLEAESVQAMRRAGIPVLLPVVSGSFGPEMFDDGFHLAPEGKRRFTQKLLPAVIEVLGEDHGQP
jgi:hypothetical protein